MCFAFNRRITSHNCLKICAVECIGIATCLIYYISKIQNVVVGRFGLGSVSLSSPEFSQNIKGSTNFPSVEELEWEKSLLSCGTSLTAKSSGVMYLSQSRGYPAHIRFNICLWVPLKRSTRLLQAGCMEVW